MRKSVWGLAFLLSFFFMWPGLAHAAASGEYDLNYDISVDAFYWATRVSTPAFSNRNGTYGGQIDVRFRQGSGMENWGFGAEYTNTSIGPRFVNTAGTCVTSFGGYTGTSVSTGTGVCGLVAQAPYQFGGGKIKYYFPMGDPRLNLAIYGNFFSSTAGRVAVGAGAELGWDFDKNWRVIGSVDGNNVSGTEFPVQLLVRYQALLKYTIANTNIHAFLGYRGYHFSRFFDTNITGPLFGLGARF